MPHQDLLIALFVILITSLVIVFLRMRLSFLDEGYNGFLQILITMLCGIVQLNCFKNIIYGYELMNIKPTVIPWWPSVFWILYVVFILHPLRNKVYPKIKMGLIDIIREEIKNKEKAKQE